MTEHPSSNLLPSSQADHDQSQAIENPYSVNIPPRDNVSKSSKKCICLTCRECICCIMGSFASLVLCVAGLLIFIFASTKSVSTEAVGPPSSVSFSNYTIGSDFIYLKWTAPTKTGGAYITSYTLQYKHGVDTNWTTILMMDDGLQLSQNMTHLNGSTHYIFRITAQNVAGYTANWSNISLRTQSAKVPQAPFAPFALNIMEAKTASNYSLTIAFTRSSNGGAPITQCSVVYGTAANDTQYKRFCTIDSEIISELNEYEYPNCTGIITERELSQLLDFKVSCSNSVGTSSFSAVTPCIIPSAKPIYYMCLEVAPPDVLSNASFTLDVSSYQMDISWIEETCSDSTPILKYEMQRTDFWQNTGYSNVSLPYNGLSKSAQIVNLLAGLPYDVRVRSMNKYGASDWSYLFIETPENGHCGNEYDTKILRDNCKQFVKSAPAIWMKCDGKDECQTTQFENKWHFSANCTSCWVQLNDCAMDICVKECLHDFNTQQCKSCIINKCSPETEICSGFADWPIDCPS